MAYAATPAATPSAGAPAPAEEGRAPPTIDSHGGKLTPVTCFGSCGVDPVTTVVAAVLLTSPVSAFLYGAAYSARPPSLFRTIIRTLPLAVLALAVLANILFDSRDASGHDVLLWGLLGTCYGLAATGDALLAINRLPVGVASQAASRLCLVLLLAQASSTQSVRLPEAVGAGLTLLALAGTVVWLWPRMERLRGPLLALLALSGVAACLALAHRTDNNAWTFTGILLLASDSLLATTLVREEKPFRSRRLTTALAWFAYYAAHVVALFGMVGYIQRF